jgi:hypothetical protein
MHKRQRAQAEKPLWSRFFVLIATLLTALGGQTLATGCRRSSVSSHEGTSWFSMETRIAVRPLCPPSPYPVPPLLPPPPPSTADWIVLTTDRLLPVAEQWAAYRGRWGHTTAVITVSSVLAGRPMAPEEFLAAFHQRLIDLRNKLPPELPLYLLLLGSPQRSADTPSGDIADTVHADTVPVFDWNGEFLTDAPYADLDHDGLPDLALGRVGTADPAQATQVLHKTIQYESGTALGAWKHRLLIFASEGKFGPLLDGLLEKVGFGLAKHIPYRWKLRFMHARKHSPFALPPDRYAERLLDEINSGALLAVYLGHGFPDGLDKVDWGEDDKGPIMDLDTVRRIGCANHCPIVVLVACHTGRPLGGDGLAERILFQPWASPAVLAATEVSHPYPNALIVSALNKQILQLHRATLGEAFRRALGGLRRARGPGSGEVEKLASVMWEKEKRTALKEAHLRLYSLLGDPALRLALPRGHIHINIEPATVTAGQSVALCAHIHGPVTGKLKLTIEAPRDVMIHPLKNWRGRTKSTAIRDRLVEENWRRANEKTVFEKHYVFTRGRFATWLNTPTTIPAGRYIVRLALTGGPVEGAGAFFLNVRPSAPAKPSVPRLHFFGH